MYKALLYQEQVVAGTNYRIELKVGKEEFVTIKVFKPLMGGQAKFMGFMKSRNLPFFKLNMIYDERNYGEYKNANKKVQSMLEQFKEEINKKLGYESDYSGVKATSYRTQRAEKGVFFEIMFWPDEWDSMAALIFRGRDGKLEFRDAYHGGISI